MADQTNHSGSESANTAAPNVKSDGWSERLRKFVEKHPFLDAIGFDVLVAWVIPWAWSTLKGEAKQHLQKKEKIRANKFAFGAIMAALQADPATEDVHDKVIAFMLWFEAAFPDRIHDIDHFKNNVANIGEDDSIADSVQFLRGFVRLPGEMNKVHWLEAMGFIGPKALDYRDKSVDFAKEVLWLAYEQYLPQAIAFMLDAWDIGRQAAADAVRYADDVLTATDAIFLTPPVGGGPNLLERTEEFRDNAFDRLRRALRR